MPKNIGKELNALWDVGASHALYQADGKWYHLLDSFPGALFDKHGYVAFATRRDYETCPDIRIGPDPDSVHVPNGISTMSSYRRME